MEYKRISYSEYRDLPKLSHYDKYPEYDGPRHNSKGDTTQGFRAYISRRYAESYPRDVFSGYAEWYKDRYGTEGLWSSFYFFIFTNFDLAFGYLPHHFLVRVPIEIDLLEDRSKNSMYIKNLCNAVMYDVKRYHNYWKLDKFYGVDNWILHSLIKGRMKKMLGKIKLKYDKGEGGPSYAELRHLKFMYEAYNWKSAAVIANDVKFRLKSGDSRVLKFRQVICESAKKKACKASVDDVSNSIRVTTDITEQSDEIWRRFYKKVKKGRNV